MDNKRYEKREVRIQNNSLANQAMQTGRKNTMLLMHNHPSTGTFSAVDLKTFCNTDSLFIITVVGNDGSVYILSKEADFNAETVLKEYARLTAVYKKYKNNATKAVSVLLKNCNQYGLRYKKGRAKI